MRSPTNPSATLRAGRRSAAAPPTLVDRYMLRQLLLALLAVTSGLVALIWLTQSLRFVELVVNRGLSLRVFLQLTSLLIPNFVSVILPITTFVVVQFVYQRMAGDRELTVMRACGLSPSALARPALALACIAVICGYLLTLWVVPAASSAFREFQFEIRNRVAAFLLQDGVFTQISEDLTVYVRRRDADGTLRGILVDDARNKASHATILAESGRLSADDGVPRVLLVNGSRQEVDHQTGRLNVLTFSQNTIELTQSGRGDEQRFRDASEMTLRELLYPATGGAAGPVNARDVGKWQVEAHRRLTGPLNAFGYALVALVSVLTGNFRRHGGLLRPAMAVLTVVGLVALGLAVGNLAARESRLIPLMWLQVAAPIAISLYVLFGPSMLAPRLKLAPAQGAAE
jgi:lipopolysaccharide export system permease protein